MFKVITAAAAEPVTLAQAQAHLRVDLVGGSHPDDDLIEAQISAAREMAEHYLGRALAEQTLEMALDEFPCSYEAIQLEMPPVASITHIKYTDPLGAEQTLDPSKYALSLYGASRQVSLTFGNFWPVTQAVADAVRIRYVTGYSTCPKAVTAAILLIVGHLYENRQEASRMTVTQIPLGAMALLDTVKVWGY